MSWTARSAWVETGRLPQTLRKIPPVVVIVAIAAIFRLINLDQSLNGMFCWREASTAMMADNFWLHSWNVFYPEVSWTGPGPSYQGREFQIVSYITALLYAVFGWHVWLGRLVAACFGIWGVFAFHRLIDRVWGRSQANAGALMLALMPGAAALDRDFLPDPAMLSLVITGLWLFVIYLQTLRFLFLPVSIAIVTLGILAKLPGLTVVLPMSYAAVYFLREKGALTARRIWLLSALLVLAAIPIIAYYRWAIYLGTTYPPFHVAGGGYIWDEGELLTFWQNRFYVRDIARHAYNWFVTFPIFALAAIGFVLPFLRASKNFMPSAPWLFHLWLAACIFLYVVAMREIAENPHNLLIFAAPVAALAGNGLLVIGRFRGFSLAPRPICWRMFLVVSIVVWASQRGMAFVAIPWAQTSVELGRHVETLSAPTDLVVITATEYGNPIGVYYTRRRGWVFPPYGAPGEYGIYTDNDTGIALIQNLEHQGARWFGVTKDARDFSGDLFMQHYGPLLAYLDRNATKVLNDERMLIYKLSD